MIRYTGQPLPANPRIALLSNDSIGGYVTMTSLLQMIRHDHPDCHLTMISGERVRELMADSDLFDTGLELMGIDATTWLKLMSKGPKFDLVINTEMTAYSKVSTSLLASQGFACGPCISAGGRDELPFPDDERGRLWASKEWVSPTLTEQFPFLRSGWIVEIFARLAHLNGPVPGYRLPTAEPKIDIPDILINTGASLTNKLWEPEKWKALCRWLADRGYSVGLIGAPPKVSALHWKGGSLDEELVGEDLAQDLRGQLSLPEVVGAISRARALVTLDNGIMHLAAWQSTPTFGLFRHDIHRLWAPPAPNINVILPPRGELPCMIEVGQVTRLVEEKLS